MDTTYISQLKCSSADCFEEIYFKYNKPLFNYFNKRIDAEAICEDLIQDTFIKLWRYRSNLDETLSFEIQLFRIAKTTLIDVARRRARHLEIYMPQDMLPEKGYKESHFFNIEKEKEKKEQLQQLFTILSPVRKKILTLKIEGYSNKEIAKELAITLKTVENNINIAYKELRKFSELSPILLLIFLRV